MPSSKTGEDDTLLVLTDDSQKEVILEKEQGARISRCRFLELNKYYPEAVVISDAGDNKGSRKKYWHKGVANMAHEEKLEGARNAFAFYYAYVGAVAQEIGEEKALQLGADLDEKMGAAAGKAIRDKEGDRELGIEEATQLSMDYIRDRFGISSEMVEDSPQRIVTHCGECPLYGAGQMMGLDAKTFETSCRVGPIKFMDSLIKQLNPKLSYRLKKFRETADDFCQEEVTLG